MDFVIDNEFQELIPKLEPDEYKLLEDNIVKEGCRDCIVVWEGKDIILDGHNRYKICKEHNIPFGANYLQFDNKNDALIWIIKNQFGRRNINNYQRSVLALKLESIFAAKAETNLHLSQGRGIKGLEISPKVSLDTRAEIAKVANVSDNTIAKVKRIEEKATPEEKESLRKGEKSINQIYTNVKRESIKESLKDKEFPKGKYRVIYADPPWEYGNHNPPEFGEQSDHYKTQSLETICNYPIKELADDNAVLFLWATSPILEDAFKVINAWGFKYKSSFIWDKVKHVMGHYNSVRHEFLLIAVKGSCQPDNIKLFDSVQTIERTKEHSQKPKEFRNIIETLYSYGNKLELFGREPIDGWTVHGNELSDIS